MNIWQVFDRFGILVLIWTSTTSFIQVHFRHNAQALHLYIRMLLGSTVITIHFLLRRGRLENKWLRACLFLGAVAFVLVVHAVCLQSKQPIKTTFVQYVACSLSSSLFYLVELWLIRSGYIQWCWGQTTMHVLCLYATQSYSVLICHFYASAFA